MRAEQRRWLIEVYTDWEANVPAKRILCTPGNHDWTATFPLSCRSEMFIDELVEFEHKRFWFTPWVNHCGDWNFQLNRADRKVRFIEIPKKLDVLVSHGPAHNCLDEAYGGEKCGCPELRQVVYDVKPKHMVCGHIHEGQRYGNSARLGTTHVHNVAMWGPNWAPTVFEV
jgi:Icc-related predicted phosphoesterase